jgi:hydroxymethylpyrimidine/phosphomethylpyrimidine kinase
MRVVLTIAGSDSSGGAGVQADLKTFAAHGVYGASAITAITAQNTVGVVESLALSADLVTAQIEAVAGDIEIHATKTGMLGDAAIVEAVAAAIKELDLPLVVVDPVLAATGGHRLLDDDGVQMLIRELLPLAHVVTPNVPESGDVTDLLFDGERFLAFRTPKIEIPNTHGTGCTFAAAVAAHLALNHDLAVAAERSQQYVAGAIRHALDVGHGQKLIEHFWKERI